MIRNDRERFFENHSVFKIVYYFSDINFVATARGMLQRYQEGDGDFQRRESETPERRQGS